MPWFYVWKYDTLYNFMSSMLNKWEKTRPLQYKHLLVTIVSIKCIFMKLLWQYVCVYSLKQHEVIIFLLHSNFLFSSSKMLTAMTNTLTWLWLDLFLPPQPVEQFWSPDEKPAENSSYFLPRVPPGALVTQQWQWHGLQWQQDSPQPGVQGGNKVLSLHFYVLLIHW